MDKPNSKRLLELLDDSNSHLRSLKTLGRKTEYWDDLVVFLISSKFDPETKQKWREQAPANNLATFEDLTTFIKTRSHHLEYFKFDSSSSTPNKSSFTPPKRSQTTLATSKERFNCVLCTKTGHTLMRCSKFLDYSIDDRRNFVEKSNLCFNCLKPSHTVEKCPNKFDKCLICKNKHHTLIHKDQVRIETKKILHPSTDLSTKPPSTSSSCLSSGIESYVFLATAVVEVMDKFDTPVLARVLLDSGSQTNFITEAFAIHLGIPLNSTDHLINGVGNTTTKIKNSAVISIKSRFNSYRTSFEALVIPKVTVYHPARQFDHLLELIPPNINLADPHFSKPQKIDILIGAELFYELQSVGQIRLADNLPVLQKTQLGWVFSGKMSVNNDQVSICNLAAVVEEQPHLDQLVERFWKLEDDSFTSNGISSENEWENHFTQTHSRSQDGRFVVRLPFIKEVSVLGESSVMARQRFLSLEKKLLKSPEVYESYKNFMHEYEQLGHMELVGEINFPHYYFPHHCVMKLDSSSTKLRVVFDGSAKTSSQVALNEILAVGPTVQNDLAVIVLRFRGHRFAVSADIEKMFRQILVHPDDQHFQYIYWRNNPHNNLSTYKLKTVTYGTTSAPFLSTRCLLQLALEHDSIYPLASSSIKQDIYVDDWLSGSNTIEDTLKLKETVSNILLSAGMNLRKWSSNSSEVLETVPEESRESVVDFGDTSYVKTLGIFWNSHQDTLKLKIVSDNSDKVTKRKVISEIAKIFDPIGLVSPVVILGKIFMQKLWERKLDWDESLSMDLHSEWLQFRNELPHLSELSIPRHIFGGCADPANIQIHGFADASQKAFGAALYIRSEVGPNSFHVKLYCSKSRVAPLKKLTLPRLELSAALLLANMVAKAKKFINFEVSRTFLWSDSMIAIQWIKSDPSRWQTFVANRVSTIQKLTDVNSWQHVSTKSNPADLISRGVLPSKLVANAMWWNGPSYLYQPDVEWANVEVAEMQEDMPEQRRSAMLVAHVSPPRHDDVLEVIKYRDRFISFRRVVAYMTRFINNCRNKTDKTFDAQFTEDEWSSSLVYIIRLSQKMSFPLEYEDLSRGNTKILHPKLKSLSLFMDKDSIIRIGGRLEMSNLPYCSKHPALLSKNHYFTLMIFDFLHRKNLHIGPQGLLNIVRQNFWPIDGRILAKQVCNKCLLCARFIPKPAIQRMGNLPAERVREVPPFYHVGVDFCGPLYIHHHIRGKPPTKTYLAVFVCFTTKAVHLELAHDLSSDSFLGVFKRFIATRGLPKLVTSDNGTNFVGAKRELSELYDLLQTSTLQDDILNFCLQNEIRWKFSPPGSPHFGGLFEAAVKSAKFHIRRVIGNANLNYNELSTLVKQTEAILNSRPLVAISDQENIEVLTPGHFLVGRPLVAIPESGVVESNLNQLQRWRLVQALHKILWSCWSNEYLQQLQHRYRWNEETENITVGKIVVLVENNLPPLFWKMGKVIETHPGTDGRVRVVTVKTATGVFKRAISKVCLLPIDVEHNRVQDGEGVNDATQDGEKITTTINI